MAELISASADATKKAHNYGSDYDLDKVYILKDKFEEAIAQIIPENEFGFTKISFVGDCLEVEYMAIAHGDMCLKTLVIDKNNNVI